MFILGNQVLNVDQPFTGLDGTQFPANWLRLTSWEEKEAIGITEVADSVRPDDRFYYVDSNGIGTPKDLDALKADWVAQIKQTANSLLAPTDWMVVRKMEGGADIPADVAAYRTAVRAASNAHETALNAITDFDTFMAAVTSLAWPEMAKPAPESAQ